MKTLIRVLPLAFLIFCGRLCASETRLDGSTQTVACPLSVAVSTTTGIPAVMPPQAVGTVTPYFQINHPCENARLAALSSTFVYGEAPSIGALTVNGRPVPIDPGGGFLTMVDLAPGTFRINAELTLGASVYALTRTVEVESPPAPSTVSPLTIEYVSPNTDVMVMPGDEIAVTAKGSPGMKASFTVGAMKKQFPLVESGGGQGIYNGIYTAGAQDKLKKAKILVTLANTKKNTRKSKKSDGTVTLLSDAPLVAETTAYNATLYAGPALSKEDTAGYYIFLPTGTFLRINGAKGDELRVRLTRTKEAWISRSAVKMLPAGTPPARAVAENIVISGSERSAKIHIPLGRRIPFEVLPDIEGKYIDVAFYGAYSNTDFMTCASTGVIEQVQWFQDDAETYRIRAYTPSKKWWGYDACYEGTSFVLEVRSPPPAVIGSTLPLAGLTIAVDAGHSPDTGAIGVTGLLERDVNLEIAGILQRKLTALGANAVMTRPGPGAVALNDRPRLAWQMHADIFVSVHNNSLNDSEDPFKKNGYEIYYYHPSSFALAKEIHAAYTEAVGTDGPAKYKLHDGGIHYGNFVITRATQMPAILTESAYMIVPREEALLKTAQFQSACADAIATGIVRYINNLRHIEKTANKRK